MCWFSNNHPEKIQTRDNAPNLFQGQTFPSLERIGKKGEGWGSRKTLRQNVHPCNASLACARAQGGGAWPKSNTSHFREMRRCTEVDWDKEGCVCASENPTARREMGSTRPRKKLVHTLIVHIGVFGVQKMVLFDKLTGDVWKTLYFCRFGRCVALALLALSFLCWPFRLLGFLDFAFSLLLLVVVSWIKFLCSSSCFCCFGFPWFYYVLSFGFVFLFWVFVFVYFGGFKGQVRWPKGPPHLALHPPYLFSFVFGLLCLFWFLFCFSFLKGLRVRWGCPKGHLTWP